MIKKILTVFAIAASALSANTEVFAQRSMPMFSQSGQKPSTRQLSDMANYDVKFYHIDLSVTNTSTTLAGSTTIKMQSKVASLSLIVLQLTSQLAVSAVVVNQQAATFSRSGDELRITPNTPIAQNEYATVKVTYSGTPTGLEGIQSTRDNSWSQTILWTLSESYHAYEWFPVKQDLTDKADSAYVWLTVPSTLTAASNGLLKKVTDMGNSKKRFEWQTYYPIDYYLLSMTVGNYTQYNNSASIDGTTMPIQHFVYSTAGCLESNKTAIDATPGMVELYSQLFVPYPFKNEKYGHVMAPIGGGMEHQTLTTLSSFGYTLIAHELAHQWFGDYVTCANWQDIWVNEGFASYLEYIYLENNNQTVAASNWMTEARQYALQEPNGSVYIPITEINSESRIFSYTLSYKKGAVIIHMLRKEIDNDEKFYGSLRLFLNTFGHSTATGMDVLNTINTYTGKDYTWFFDQWYYGKGYPTVSSTYKYANDTVALTLKQTASNVATPFFRMSMDVRFTTNGVVTDTTLVWTANNQEFKVKTGGAPTTIVLDPQNELLIKRNGAPVDINENTRLSQVRVFPNPAKDDFIVEVNPTMVGAALVIHDLSGRIAYRTTLGKERQEISTSNWIKGIYLGTITHERVATNFKMVKE
ncbi:M1 family aminopeptidase [Williamwhitmania taraxaci]|uniref:Aminopeptidase N n=1 Tax=Williamwhitmania taraxaci TaxID=1640674 RepID=A0A1G6HAY3_9BACT|nr:M1 family aminopeptidase [Williamwhitmania taraxaci]SDB91457.1 Por secretion system C-terminal sorting domain-containing protein [Williamwhitmania taraxaci]